MENTEQKTCQVQMRYGDPCGRPLYDCEKCICHSEKEDKDVELFQRELDKIFDDVKTEYYDLASFVFPKSGYKLPKEYDKTTYFTWANFSGGVDFSGATFAKYAGFTEAKFAGDASFVGATFTENADFNYATFLGETAFMMSTFSKASHFGETTFKETVSFNGAMFSGDTFFGKAIFLSNADFGNAMFLGKAEFMRATFSGSAAFRGAMFSKILSFVSTVFEKIVLFSFSKVYKDSVVVFDGEGLQKQQKKMFVGEADFTSWGFAEPKNIHFRKVSFDKSRFLETDVTEMQFVDVAWAKKPKFLKWFPRNAVHDEDSENPDYNLIAQLYRRLQANYVNNYRYSEAGDFYIGEQEMMRKAKGKVGQYLSTNFLYKVISYYGESFTLPLFWLAFVLLLFPAVLLWDGINLNPSVQNPTVAETVNYEWSWSPGDFLPVNGDSRHDYWEAFVANFSLIAYSRSDIGKYLPETHTRFIVTIESLVIIALLAFFLLALRRQYKRKTF